MVLATYSQIDKYIKLPLFVPKKMSFLIPQHCYKFFLIYIKKKGFRELILSNKISLVYAAGGIHAQLYSLGSMGTLTAAAQKLM